MLELVSFTAEQQTTQTNHFGVSRGLIVSNVEGIATVTFD